MPTYILLSSLTAQGVQTLRSNPDRLREVNKDVEELGAKVLHQWATLGPFDFVNVVEAPDAATIGGVRQVVFFTGRRLLGVAPKDGKVLWEFPWLTQFEVNAATPVVFRAKAGGSEATYVFISSGYDRGCALVKVEARDGGERFVARRVYESDALCSHFSSPVRYKDHVYGLD